MYSLPCFLPFSGCRNFAHIIGVVVRETQSETAMATLKVTANSRNNFPTIPPINRMGMNTAISERLMDNTVNPISCRSLHGRFVGSNVLPPDTG